TRARRPSARWSARGCSAASSPATSFLTRSSPIIPAATARCWSSRAMPRPRASTRAAGKPPRSRADSPRMREAIARLDVVVAIDVFMTETARLADYVLPAVTQFEKHEATFFNFEFPRNVFHLRHPLLSPPDAPLPEPETHARLVEAAGVFRDAELEPLRAAARRGRREFATAFAEATRVNPRLGAGTPVALYQI